MFYKRCVQKGNFVKRKFIDFFFFVFFSLWLKILLWWTFFRIFRIKNFECFCFCFRVWESSGERFFLFYIFLLVEICQWKVNFLQDEKQFHLRFSIIQSLFFLCYIFCSVLVCCFRSLWKAFRTNFPLSWKHSCFSSSLGFSSRSSRKKEKKMK